MINRNSNQVAVEEVASKLLATFCISVLKEQNNANFWINLQDYALMSEEYSKYFTKVPVSDSNYLDVTPAFNFEDNFHPIVLAFSDDYTAGIALIDLKEPPETFLGIDEVEGEEEIDTNDYLIKIIKKKFGEISYKSELLLNLREDIFDNGIVLYLTESYLKKPSVDNRMYYIANNLVFLAKGLRTIPGLFKSQQKQCKPCDLNTVAIAVF